MTAAALVVLTTLANDADARALVTALVAARLVACATLLPGARSIYRWEGQVREEAEVVVLLKTDASRWEALCAAVRERNRLPRPAPSPHRRTWPAPACPPRSPPSCRRPRRRPRRRRGPRSTDPW